MNEYTPATRGLRHFAPTLPLEVRNAEETGGAVFSGYAAVFNTETRVQELFGEVMEIVLPGAFKKTIAERGPKEIGGNGQIKVLYKHNGRVAIAARLHALREDDKGLWFEAETIDTAAGRDLAAELRSDVVDTMSFGFDAIRQLWDETKKRRELLEVRLYEISPVNWPAYAGAKIAQVRDGVVSGDLAAGFQSLLADIRSGRVLPDEGRESIIEARALLDEILGFPVLGADGNSLSPEPPSGTLGVEPPSGTPSEAEIGLRARIIEASLR